MTPQHLPPYGLITGALQNTTWTATSVRKGVTSWGAFSSTVGAVRHNGGVSVISCNNQVGASPKPCAHDKLAIVHVPHFWLGKVAMYTHAKFWPLHICQVRANKRKEPTQETLSPSTCHICELELAGNNITNMYLKIPQTCRHNVASQQQEEAQYRKSLTSHSYFRCLRLPATKPDKLSCVNCRNFASCSSPASGS